MTTTTDKTSHAYSRELEDAARGQECRNCGSDIETGWVKGEYAHVCKCKGQAPAMERRLSATQKFMRGHALPIHTQNVMEKKYGRRATLTSQQLVAMSDTEILASNKGLFGGITEAPNKERCLALVRAGFDPRLHLEVYQHRPMVNIDGMYWWAGQRKDKIFERIVSEPIIDDKLREMYGVAPHEIAVISKIYVEGLAEPYATGFGRASRDAGTPVQRGSAVESMHPYRMAEKRAEAQAIRKFHPPAIEGFEQKDESEMAEEVKGAIEAKYTVQDRVAPKPEYTSEELWCEAHQAKWFKGGKMKELGHIVEGEIGPKQGKVWCWREEALAKKATRPQSLEAPQASQAEAPGPQESKPVPEGVDPGTGEVAYTWTDIIEFLETSGLAAKAVKWMKMEHGMEVLPEYFTVKTRPPNFEKAWIAPLMTHLWPAEKTDDPATT
jgi:hypothetical protein